MAMDQLSLAQAPETWGVGPQRTPDHAAGYSTPHSETALAQTPSPPSHKSARQQGFEPPPPPPTSSESPEQEPAVVVPPEAGASGWDRVGAGLGRGAAGVGGGVKLGAILITIVVCVSPPPHQFSMH